MPKAVSEVADGNQFSRSANQGQIADAAVRTFRILLNSPAEAFDIQATCGVFIGDPHPINPNIPCTSFDAKYESDTRMVLLATFQYASTPAASGGGGGQQDPKQISPIIRPANWSIGTEVTEQPLREWRKRTLANQWGLWERPLNPVGDMYEGLSTLKPVTTIGVTQFVLGGGLGDPTAACEHVGKINSEPINLGSLLILPHELMLRGVTATPTVESWGNIVFRGWSVEYSFLYKKQSVWVNFFEDGGAYNVAQPVDIGWDIAVVVEGRNVVCFNPATGAAWDDPYGQPLKKGDDDVILDPNNLELAPGVAVGSRQRAHVKIGGFSARGASQTPANEPIALNADGTPRLISAARPPIIWAYQIYRDIPMVPTLQLRLSL